MRRRLGPLALGLVVLVLAGCTATGTASSPATSPITASSTPPPVTEFVKGGPDAVVDRSAPPSIAGIGQLPKPASAWPAAQYDARHSSGTTAVGPQHGVVRWTADLGGNLTPGPVIGVDGSVLQASNDGVLTAVDPATGHIRWRFDGGGSYGIDLSTSPAVLASGLILWPGPNSTLFAVTQAGRLAWRVPFTNQVLSPAVAGRNRVYVADTGGVVRALVVTPTSHRVAWTLQLHSTDDASPAVAPDGTILTATDHALVGIHDAGDRGVVAWRFATKQMVEVSNGVSAKGVVVLGTNNDLEYGVDSRGHRLWGLKLHRWTYSSSTVRPDGTAYFGDNGGAIRVVDAATGKVLRAVRPVGGEAWTSIAVDARGDFYWGSVRGHIFGYRPDGTLLFDMRTKAGSDSYPAISADGTLYVATTDGHLLAIRG